MFLTTKLNRLYKKCSKMMGLVISGILRRQSRKLLIQKFKFNKQRRSRSQKRTLLLISEPSLPRPLSSKQLQGKMRTISATLAISRMPQLLKTIPFNLIYKPITHSATSAILKKPNQCLFNNQLTYRLKLKFKLKVKIRI